jgi:hypothetical protein
LTINVPTGSQVATLQILRNDVAIDTGAWNQPLPIDGGHYTITARAPKYDTWTTTVDIKAESDTKSVDVPKLKLSPVPVRGKPPYLLSGAAVVGLAAALTLELVAENTYANSKVEKNIPDQLSQWHTADAERYVAEALGVGGLACAGFAVWRYFHRTTMESPTQVSIVPLVGEQTGLQLLGHY